MSYQPAWSSEHFAIFAHIPSQLLYFCDMILLIQVESFLKQRVQDAEGHFST